MPSQAETVDWMSQQLAAAGAIRTRKMFGEYGLYCNEVFCAQINEDELYIKRTEAGEALGLNLELAEPYAGAKLAFHIPRERLQNPQPICDLLAVTIKALG